MSRRKPRVKKPPEPEEISKEISRLEKKIKRLIEVLRAHGFDV